MNKLYLMSLLFIIYCAIPGNASDNDFRNTTWGMSKAQVLKTEKGTPVENAGDNIVYKSKVSSFDAITFYSFINNKLVLGAYSFQENHMNANEYISDYKKLKKNLTIKYGEPIEDITNWKNNLFKNRPESWGTAVGTGHLSFFTKWGTSTTEILLALTGDNFKETLVIKYESKKHRDLLKNKTQESDAEGL